MGFRNQPEKQQKSDADETRAAKCTAFDPDFAEFAAAWPDLPADVRQGILDLAGVTVHP